MLSAVAGPYAHNLYLIMAIIGLTGWDGYARFVRAEFLKLRQQDFVQSAVAAGLPLRSVLFRHMLPDALPRAGNRQLGVASAILLESTLSFLGLGLIDEPSWGRLLNQAWRGGNFHWWLATSRPGDFPDRLRLQPRRRITAGRGRSENAKMNLMVKPLSQLGSKSQLSTQQIAEPRGILEAFDNPRPGREYEIQFVFPEFTSLCPVTGQPDFATITVRYVPDKRCVEMKSLKLYFFAYRNRGIFYEAVVNTILDDLVAVLSPRQMTVVGEFAVRGGTAGTVTASYAKKHLTHRRKGSKGKSQASRFPISNLKFQM